MGYPFVILMVAIFSVFVTWAVYLPRMEEVTRWRLAEMKGYYLCAMGEEGFDQEGYDDLLRKSAWILASMESHELFADFPLAPFFHNNKIIDDINAMVKELA